MTLRRIENVYFHTLLRHPLNNRYATLTLRATSEYVLKYSGNNKEQRQRPWKACSGFLKGTILQSTWRNITVVHYQQCCVKDNCANASLAHSSHNLENASKSCTQ
ncbi:hypothetical protein ACFE04_027460 [Oxalis oulophora]